MVRAVLSFIRVRFHVKTERRIWPSERTNALRASTRALCYYESFWYCRLFFCGGKWRGSVRVVASPFIRVCCLSAMRTPTTRPHRRRGESATIIPPRFTHHQPRPATLSNEDERETGCYCEEVATARTKHIQRAQPSLLIPSCREY